VSAESDLDVAIVGAGAAGLATAIFTRLANPRARVAVLEGAHRPGAKILVSGGSRCNVTNTVVTEADFNGGRPTIIRRVLRALPVPATVAFFRGIGVPLHEEAGGKLFPDSNRSRDVLDALLREVERAGAQLRAGLRVLDVTRHGDAFEIATSEGTLSARAVVLATGGLSLPKTGSDGAGYGFAQRLGHSIVPTTPALAPLVLEAGEGDSLHRELSGVAQRVRLDVRVDGAIATSIAGSLLWTHFGISGPAALDASRHWLRAHLENRVVHMTASLSPDAQFDSLEREWIALARTRPRARVQTMLAGMVPASVAAGLLRSVQIPADEIQGDLTRDHRRALIHAMLAWPLPITDSRGYNYAEVTAGGITVTEIDPSTMASRVCSGLYLVGEILDVDGRIGGFNFQWAWCTARIAGDALARRVDENRRIARADGPR
jgi:predicted Rossmann fold flavoprotein